MAQTSAAAAATSPDEKALQIDYQALKEKFRAALGDRKVALCHINKFLPEGYEDQGRFNLVLLTAGNVVFDIVIGDSYFRYDVVSVGQLDKVQVIDAMWDNKEKRREEPQRAPQIPVGRPTRRGTRRRPEYPHRSWAEPRTYRSPVPARWRSTGCHTHRSTVPREISGSVASAYSRTPHARNTPRSHASSVISNQIFTPRRV